MAAFHSGLRASLSRFGLQELLCRFRVGGWRKKKKLVDRWAKGRECVFFRRFVGCVCVFEERRRPVRFGVNG